MRTIFAGMMVAWAVFLPAASGIPQVGDRLPDVVGIDEAGDEFPLREKLKGKHAVLVFGCLT